MKIIQIIPDFGLGGIQKGGCVLARGLRELGCEVLVVGLGEGPRMKALVASGIECCCVAQHDGRSLLKLVQLFGPEIIHIHSAGVEFELLDVLHDVCPIISTPVFGKPIAAGVKYRTHLCCVGNFVAWRLWRWLGRPEQGIFWIPITPYAAPANGASSTNLVTVNQIRSKYGLTGRQVVGRCGRNDILKWHPQTEVLVDKLLRSSERLAWLSVGMPVELGADRLKIKWGDRFVNLCQTADFEELALILAAMDVHVFASRYGECFSASIAEGLGLGVPCVALVHGLGDSGEVEQILHGETGALAANMEGMLQATLWILSDGDRLLRLKHNSEKYVNEHWGYLSVSRRLVDFYTDVLSGRAEVTPAGMRAFEVDYYSRLEFVFNSDIRFKITQFVARTVYLSRVGFLGGRAVLHALRFIRRIFINK